MEQINTDQLKKAFHQEMINLCKRRNQELKYKSTRLLDFINKYGGYEAAVKYITTESNVQDFAILWENERLDLSVEALITKPLYTSLFLEDIVTYCDQKLKQYSYAPNKIEEEVKEEDNFEKMLEDIFNEIGTETSEEIAKIKAKEYTLYNKDLGITKEAWKEIFIKPNVFSAKNQDLILRVYLMGSGIEASDLANEEGYTATYPFKEVILALAKRIKANLKIDAPVGDDGKIIWWHMIFIGGFKDNTCFEWTVRPELGEAIDELVAEGKVSLEGIEVKAHKEVELPEVTKEEKAPEKTVEEVVKPPIGRPVTPVKRSVPQTIDELVDALLGDVVTSEPEPEIEQEKAVVVPKVETVAPTAEKTSSVSTSVAPIVPKQEKMEMKEDQVTDANDYIAEEIAKSLAQLKEEQTAHKLQTVDIADYDKAKAACIEYYGAICDLCGFDYGYTYGEAFENQIEVHNINSHDEVEVMENTDPIKDLIPVCHNCHGVIHSQNPPISVEKMRQMIKA